MKLLITGGSGFIGSHTVEKALAKGHDVSVVDNLKTGSLDYITPVLEHIRFYSCDLLSPCFDKLIQSVNPEVIIHLAAQASVSSSLKDPIYDAQQNVLGTLRVIDLAAQHSIRKVVFSSTAAVYGPPKELPIPPTHPATPVSYYGMSKRLAEQYLTFANERHGTEFTILRYGNVYGPRQSVASEGGVVSIFASHLSQKLPVKIYGDGEQTRDFVFVKDLAEANLAALTKGNQETLNISSSNPITVNDLYKKMADLAGSHQQPVYEQERNGDVKHSTLCNKLTQSVLRWTPKTSLDDGLQETYRYYRQFPTGGTS
ncbi:UDP-glucose 4-epimerase [Pontibacillus halophilus JSM 076056 = DSM 19796]|uniref:UDP-glucose 4-epimerase n=1 Tax=Pontibacillus halophilus JSM 076056 = DSM 19796 TaxID=1385510 RepID=A0A0A5GGR8_9BACI|nr:NAD-dependent epimerase/dehydratase family protein [Pontibacillus halophilus]KGX92431.1 UDP-glucose 4-epimerase [Pontibacillus halophilus JSM 076056 = DSM 19796]